MVFEGTIQGQALSERLSLDGPYAGDWLLAGFPGGFVSLDVAEGSSADPREIAGGVLGFPTGSAREGEVWCVDPGSLMSSETRPDGALVGHLLGTCSGGTSLAGPLYLCYDGGDGYCDDDSADPSKRTLAGELGGQAVAPPVGGWGSLTGSVWIEHTDHFGVVLFAAEVANEAAPVDVAGYVIGQSGSPYEGEVYCISAGTWSQYSDDYVYQADQVVITEVTRLGSCSDGGAQDRLDVCIGY